MWIAKQTKISINGCRCKCILIQIFRISTGGQWLSCSFNNILPQIESIDWFEKCYFDLIAQIWHSLLTCFIPLRFSPINELFCLACMRTICAAHTYSNSIEMLNAWAFHIPISVSIDVLYDSDLLMILIIKSDFFKPCSAHLAPLFLFSVFEVSKHGHFITTKDMTKKVLRNHMITKYSSHHR